MRGNSRSYWFAILTLILVVGPVLADDDFKPPENRSLHIQRAPGKISIDGRLDDPGWANAAVADNFTEYEPGDNVRPPVETRGYLTYDDDYLYVAIVANDNPAEVRSSLCQRDRTPGDDNLGFFFDTFGDADWGYVFFVNRHGVQYDALWTDNTWDTKYDLIWESAGSLTDSGFQVEMAIPFASLRFPDEPVQNWKMNFERFHEREVSYRFSWYPQSRSEPCSLCQFGSLTGIENVKPGRGIEIIPAMTGYQSGLLVEDDSGGLHFENEDADGELSLSAKYAISSSITAEFAVNPDFSQVEADANQIDVNSTTALSFPEKRPFFQEGTDLFSSLYDVVYTRSINDPSFAAKGIARIGRTSLAYLGAYDEHSPVIVPFEEFSSGVFDVGKSMSNIVSMRQSFGENSRIGFLATDRRYDQGGAGSAFSLDGNLRLSQSFSMDWQVMSSRTAEPDDTLLTDGISKADYIDDSVTFTPATAYLFDDEHTAAFDGETFWGHAYFWELAYNPRDFSASIEYHETSPTFRLENGYQPYNSRRNAYVRTSYQFRFDQGLIRSFQPLITAFRDWNHTGRVKREKASLSLDLNLRWNQTNVHPMIETGSEYYAGKQFDNLWTIHQCFGSSPSKRVALGGGINYSNRIARRARVTGREAQWWLWVDLQPVDQLIVANSFDWVQSQNQATNEWLYKGFQARSSLNYQFNRELSLRCVVQYSDFSDTWDIDPLLTYRINPFTMFYIGTTYDYQKLDGLNQTGDAYASDGEAQYDHNRLTSRQFFMKLQYLFQL